MRASIVRFLAASSLLLSTGAFASDSDVWAGAYDEAAGTRFIPIELWSGATWNGARELDMTKARLVFGKHGEKTLEGPSPWLRQSTGETIQVYERTQTSRDGQKKKQLFAVSSRGDGMGRVYDSRYGRDCVDEVKFPLGLWKQGEKRVFEVSCNGDKLKRVIEVTIEKIDFTFEGVAHSLRFHWVVDGGKWENTDNHYTYSPGKGLVALEDNKGVISRDED